ncbi:MAG: hypothetical protein FWF60_05780 [Oscillospiraceae bacterium]|nr:hypothetical protein [Oscillospiraceae bacterium]
MKALKFIGGVMILLATASLALASLALAGREAAPHAGGTAAETDTAPPDTAPADTEPPKIFGVHDLAVGLRGAPAYRQGITVTDAVSGATLEVDSAGVDTGEPGEYTVIYIARDAAGNEARAYARVVVAGVTEEALAALAEPVLRDILPPGADDAEKALAIHTWVHENITYTGVGEKSSVLEGAYNGLLLRRGDCYTFYALSKYFLGRAGIASVDMRRVPEAETRHYWLALDLGEGWRHFDACPVALGYNKYRPRSGFMMTGGEAQKFAEGLGLPDYYRYDPGCLPDGVEIAG